MKRRLLIPGMIWLAIWPAWCSPAAAASRADDRPNIILIVADDLGFSDLGCYGGEIETPNLDRLAAEGLRFTRFYNNAKCETTRTSLLNGVYAPEGPRGPGIAAAMKQAGYGTYMVGKWHQGGKPRERGFDRYYGFLSGMVNFWTGENYKGEANAGNWLLDDHPVEVPKEGFYTTDAFTDRAIEWIDRATAKPEPFFLYLAHNAPHYPLHAPQAEIDKYRGRYLRGWDALRRARYQRQVTSGLLDPSIARLSPRAEGVPAWDTLTEEEKVIEDLRFATYAAMVDRLDQNVGRLVKHLEAQRLAGNTLILFLSDNGGCPFARTRTPDLPPGGPESYWTLTPPWANLNNTPFRFYKQDQYEGGISTPLIAWWPDRIREGGRIVREWAHVIDLMPTCLDLAGVPADRRPEVLRGRSFQGLLLGEKWTARDEHWFAFRGKHAFREGEWKIARGDKQPWALYNLAEDRSEIVDLMAAKPEIGARLIRRWETVAGEIGFRARSR